MATDFPRSDGDVGTADDVNRQMIYNSVEIKQLTAGTTEGSVNYSSEKKCHIIRNYGSNNAYITFDTTATTNDLEIAAGETRTIYGAATSIHAITASGSTDLRIIGLGD